MAKIEARRQFPDKSASDCYKACLALVDKAGYQLFKKRDIANMVICNGVLQDLPVDLTLMVPFGSPTSVMVSIASDRADEAVLTAEAERILGLLSGIL